ncbi:recQ-mediated genome instability protein 1 [Silene latifolia]|uniref:recQ-mediated genome instability protein 1 n=1 Tax=Silene latifolia TaxID=37657 RepID=UPI003D775CC8
MSSRHRRMVYSSSDDDNDNEQQQQQQQQHDDNNNDIIFEDHQQQRQQQEEGGNNNDNDAVFEDAIFEDEAFYDDIQMPNISDVTLNSTPTATTTTTAAIEISDEDFIDVAENLSTPSPPPPPQTTTPVIAAAAFTASDCPVYDQLRKMGLWLKRDWLNSCQLGLQNSVPGFGNFDVETKAKLCFGQFLNSDMNFVGAGVLPENVCGLHLVDLAGPFVLQVDEVVNISCPLRDRYKNAAPGIKRCLKLSMTDGVQRVFGMEYRPIKSLAALSPAGFKVVIRNVHVRRGLLMLVPEVMEVLGGSVEELEKARQRLVQEVNKPPRGKRTRSGTLPPLSNRATRAAWPENGVTDHSVPSNVANPAARNTTTSVVHGAAQLRRDFQGADTLGRSGQATPAGRETTEFFGGGRTNQHSISRNTGAESMRRESDQHSISRESAQQSNSTEAAEHATTRETASLSSVAETHEFPVRRETTDLYEMGGTNQHSVNRNSGHQSERSGSDQYSINRESCRQSITSEAAQHPIVGENSSLSSAVETPELPVRREATGLPCSGENNLRNSTSTAVVEDEDVQMVEYMEHPLIQSGEKEFPFTYLACLSAKWEAMQDIQPSVQGKIKCIMTGVKGFQYKGRSTFELQGYIDDGSSITEVFIHHNVVQSKLGHSPQEITASVTSSDSEVVESTKKILFQFQKFLLTFEGTMLVEMNKTSRHPVVLEMTESCIGIDVWQLLHRVKHPTSSPLPQNDISNVISLSP